MIIPFSMVELKPLPFPTNSNQIGTKYRAELDELLQYKYTASIRLENE